MAFTRLTTNTTTSGGSRFVIGTQGAQLTAADSITITDGFHEVVGSTTINTINGGEADTALILYRPTGATWALGSSGNVKATSSTATERCILLFTPDGTTWYGLNDGVSVDSADSYITVTESAGTYTVDFNPSVIGFADLSGTCAVAQGGTGQTSVTAAFDALAPTTTQGDLIYHNGTDNIRLAKGTANQLLAMNSGATAPEWVSNANAPFLDTNAIVVGSGDATKKFRLEVDGISASTTRVGTVPNTNFTLAGTDVAQTFTAAQTFTGNVVVGSTGTAVKAIWTASTTWDAGNILAQASANTTVSVTGAAVGDIVVVVQPDGLAADAFPLFVTAAVTAANTVTLRLFNASATAHNPNSYTYYVMVFDIT